MRVLLTASEAYPELERCFLNAQTEIWASFRVFDLDTRLRSAEAKEIGQTWFDLVVDTLRRGVYINIVVSDFDPIARAELHRGTWRSVRMFAAAADLAGPSAKLAVTPAMHASETGIGPRTLFWPKIFSKLSKTANWLNGLQNDIRTTALREMPGAERRLRAGANGLLRPRYWPLPRLFPATHHQKLAVFDRSKLYIGGLDLDERRYDTPDHDRPSDQTWHDVQLMVEIPAVVAEAQTHLESFLAVVEGKAEPPQMRRMLRTISRKRKGLRAPFFGPEPLLQEIATAHEVLAGRARKLIYIETQFFRDRHLAQKLADCGRREPGLSVVLILPAAPEDVAFEGKRGIDARYGEFLQARALRVLRKGFGKRLVICAAAQPRRAMPSNVAEQRDRIHNAPIIYIHAKVSIFDEAAAIVSSANLNGRSLKWDTEAGVLLDINRHVTELRRRVMAHWLPGDAGPEFFALDTAAQAWRKLALQNARAMPEDRRGLIVPYDFAAAEAFGKPLPVVPEEMM